MMDEERTLFQWLFDGIGINQAEASILLASLALLVSISAIVQTAGVRRKEWRLEAVALAAEASARARRCQQLVLDLRPTVESVFEISGMTESSMLEAYHQDLTAWENHGLEVEDFAEGELKALSSFVKARFGLQKRIQGLTKALHDIRGTEDTLVTATNRFTDELMDVRNRQLIPAPRTQ